MQSNFPNPEVNRLISFKYDLTGQKFGEWTVLEEGKPYKNRTDKYTRRRWICKCSCGKEELVLEQNLISGKSIKCTKCAHKENLRKIEIGQIYGKWKVIECVIEPDYNRNYKGRWLCECQCQLKTKKELNGVSLLNKNSKQCGKLGCDETKAIADDNGKIIKRICPKCGKMQPIEKFTRNNKITSVCTECEPFNQKTKEEKEYIADLKKRYNLYRHKKNTYDKPFNLSLSEFEEITNQKCFYCGQYTQGKNHCGIDRIDSNKGYEKGNMVPCCTTCNTMKMNEDVDYWLNTIKKICDRADIIRQELGLIEYQDRTDIVYKIKE